VKARYGVVNGLGASSNTTSVKPHEFFDHTTCGGENALVDCSATIIARPLDATQYFNQTILDLVHDLV